MRYEDFQETIDFWRKKEGEFDEIRSEIGSSEDEVDGVSVSEVDDLSSEPESIEEDIQHYEPPEIELVASISTTRRRSLPLAIPRIKEEMSSSSDMSNVAYLNRTHSSDEGKSNLEQEGEPEIEPGGSKKHIQTHIRTHTYAHKYKHTNTHIHTSTHRHIQFA